MRTGIRTVAACAVLSLASLAASAQDVKTDYDKNADFKSLKTFSTKLGTSWGNSMSENRIMERLEAALSAKGWQKVASGGDALVALHGASSTKRSVNTFYSGDAGWGGYGYRGWGGGGMSMGTATTTESEYQVGTIVVDIFNASSKQLVFRGTASDTISDKIEKNMKKVDKAYQKMFKNFPPGSEKKK
jgi:hypothetical protein